MDAAAEQTPAIMLRSRSPSSVTHLPKNPQCHSCGHRMPATCTTESRQPAHNLVNSVTKTEQKAKSLCRLEQRFAELAPEDWSPYSTIARRQKKTARVKIRKPTAPCRVGTSGSSSSCQDCLDVWGWIFGVGAQVMSNGDLEPKIS